VASLISQIKAFFSRGFLLGYYLPTLVFLGLNVGTAAGLERSFRTWVMATVGAADFLEQGFLGMALSLLIGLVALALSSFGETLRRVLEGSAWPWLTRWGLGAEVARLDALELRIGDAISHRQTIDDAVAGWLTGLVDARRIGVSTGQPPQLSAASRNAIADLRSLRRADSALDYSSIDAAVRSMFADLAAGNANAAPANPAVGNPLDRAHQELVLLIHYAVEQAAERHVLLVNERERSFGSAHVASTRLGNVAGTAQSYAVRTYNFNLDLLWSRLQLIVRAKNEQLDLLVMSCWFTAVWSTIWMPIFLVTLHPLLFLLAALVGPLVARVWYLLAVEEYRAFGGVMRATVDLYRTDLLTALRFELPDDLESERFRWDLINQLVDFGETTNVRFAAKEPS
jgi:hypothetical protein